MRAVHIKSFGGPEQLEIVSLPEPTPGPRDILVDIHATALNRADLLQRAGKYPPMPGESPILGLEMAGIVVKTGTEVSRWQVGDRVCGLLGGGGYAERCVIPEDLAMPIPNSLDFQQAAAIPEVFLTAYQALHWLARLQEKETVLIHAGASGVGTAATQLAGLLDAHILVTASAGKHDLCRELGAQLCIDYQNEHFVDRVLAETNKKGADVIIDFIGAPYFTDNIRALGLDGRLVMLAFLGGHQMGERLNLGPILRKRLQITGSTLRSRSLDYKIRLSRDLQEATWSHFASGRLRPVIDSTFPLEAVQNAHRHMEANRNQGKIVLVVKA